MSKKQYLPIGKHVIFDLTLPRYKWWVLNDALCLRNYGQIACHIAKTKVTEIHITGYEPQGLSILFQLEESHLSMHTYPECGVLMGDFFTCGADADPEKGSRAIIEDLHCSPDFEGTVIQYQVIHRGKG
jgi:S-adenosylmethionine/arginine decarboxylase-like enzyme